MQPKKPGNSLFNTVGPALVLAYLGVMAWNTVTGYGDRWNWGPKYGLPVSVTADGITYKNGQQMDQVSQVLYASGNEEKAFLIVWGSLLASAVALALLFLYLSRKLKQ
jgi:hypothetical protein